MIRSAFSETRVIWIWRMSATLDINSLAAYPSIKYRIAVVLLKALTLEQFCNLARDPVRRFQVGDRYRAPELQVLISGGDQNAVRNVVSLMLLQIFPAYFLEHEFSDFP
jgi:hypothetical protein